MLYHELAEKLCPDYMAMGMSYDDYWNGEPDMVRYYRKTDELKKKQRNFDFWLQGLYIYEALLDASPMFHDLAKSPKPIPYLSEPYALSKEEIEAKIKKDEEEKDKQNQETVKAWVERANRIRAEREKIQKGEKVNGG